jgi:hypothetical protein
MLQIFWKIAVFDSIHTVCAIPKGGRKMTKARTYRVSTEVDLALKKLAESHGGIDKALRTLLFPEFIPGSYALLGPFIRCRVFEYEGASRLKVILMDGGVTVSAQTKDLKPYSPTDAEKMEWRLKGSL